MSRKEGGIKAAATNRAKYGEDFYRQIGSKGGSAPATKPRGFAAMSLERRRAAGSKGGSASHRTMTWEQKQQSAARMRAVWQAKKEQQA